jgi:16S rRNA (uracil1498-N3)-methyltransferase
MKEKRFFYVPNAQTQIELPEEEAAHATRVLRLTAGDEIFLMDGLGTFYRAHITTASNKHCLYDIDEAMPQEKGWRGRIHLAIAPTKMMDRMEWMVEKATEIGFDELTFLNCRFSERRTIRMDRIEKIVISAMKQSRKPWLPKLNDMVDFGTFIHEECEGAKFYAHCYREIERQDLFESLKRTPRDKDVTILIGPEGDFALDEVELAYAMGYKSVTFGETRLRTETAGLMAVAMSQLLKRTK